MPRLTMVALALGTMSCAATVGPGGDGAFEDSGKADDPSDTAPQAPAFMVVGHRGSPWTAVENTLPSFSAALREGANAIEIDVCVTADPEVVIWHDCDPDDATALARQLGIEELPAVPDVPWLESPFRTNVRNLTLAQVREHYGYAPHPALNDERAGALDFAGAHIPTLDELAAWARTDEARGLGALFVDIKLAEHDIDLLPILAQKLVDLFENAPFAVFMMSPREPVVVALRDWLEAHAPALRDRLIFDFETSGALEGTRRLGLRTLSTGMATPRSWSSYFSELRVIVGSLGEEGAPRVDTVIAWTIDDETQMQALLDLGVDGVLTNIPGDLARMADRGFTDHDRAIAAIADCHAAHAGSDVGALCARGGELGLFAALHEDQLVERACTSADDQVRDVFGCGPLDAQDVRFDTDLLPTDDGAIYWNAYAREVLVWVW
jgi:glycerophosphoryl diester phosphodiesterase